MILEVIFNIVHVPPWLDFNFTYNNQTKNVRYSMDNLIVFLMLSRTYLVLRLSTKYTKWRGKNAQMKCNREGIEADTMFALKCLMKTNPYTILSLAFLFSSVVFGFAIRVLERPYYEDAATGKILPFEDGYQDWNFLNNGWWCMVVTMTTVGFGDFFAVTYLGRLVSIVACFYGVFLVSLMVVTLENSSKFAGP